MFKCLYNNQTLSDVIIECGNRSWFVHKCILYAQSSYFRGLFENDYQESLKEKITFDFSPSTMEIVLKHVYSYEQNIENVSTMLEVLQLADYLGICSLSSKIDIKLRSVVSIDNCKDMYEFCSRTNLIPWIHNFIRRNLNVLTDITWLDEYYVNNMLKRSDIGVVNISELRSIIASYISAKSLSNNLLEFLDEIERHPILRKNYGKVNPKYLLDDIIEHCIICRQDLGKPCVECMLTENENCVVSHGNCGHTYHKHCIDRWLKTRNICPIDNNKWV